MSVEENKNTQISGAEAVIRSLVDEGIEIIYGYPGGAIMPIYDALWHYTDKILHVLTRHEQGATHAAEGYARVKGKAAVVFATSGPGATNLVTGIADAVMDSTPMVCITGQVPKHLLGTDAFQETDVVGITMPIVKWSYQVTRAAEIPEIIAKAFYVANTGKPGPVLVDITKNAQFEMMEWKGYKKCDTVRGYTAQPAVDAEKIAQAAALINQAKKPLILAGQGVIIAKAREELEAFSTKTGIPVATTMQGLGCINPEHPNFTGIPGMHGNYSVNIKMNECDVMIAVGMRFDDRVTGDVSRFGKQAKVIHIEIDAVEIDKVVQTEVGILADAKEALNALLPMVNENNHAAWIDTFKALDRQEQEKVIAPAIHPNEGGIKMGEIMNLIDEKTKGEAIVVPDVGQHQMYAMRYYNYRKPNSWVSSGGLGTMGFALPAAIGAQMAAPDRTVVAIIGDGCFQMTIQELGTIWQQNLPIKTVIFNNNYLGMVRQWQELFFDKRYSYVNLKNPDFVAISKGYGIASAKVSDRAALSAALDDMFAHNGAYVLEVTVEREENLFPMVPSGAACSEVILEPAK
jgi:acetolactate synthase-1/2/3 large subunit